MCENFIYAITVGARKFDDTDHRSRSLWVMLYQILENPGVINRRAYKALYSKERVGVSDTDFDSLVGNGKKMLSQIQIRSDLRKIEDANERIRRLVNKEIAHFAPPGRIRRRPTYPELDNALDTIVKLLHKYNLLLTARNEEFISGVGIWMNVLKEPWIAS